MSEEMSIKIESMLPQITEQVAAEIRKRALDNLSYEVTSAVQNEVRRYLVENIVPGVTAELQKHDAEIRAAFVEAVRQCAQLATDAVVKKAAEKMAGYDGDKMLKEIFGAIFPRY